MLKKFGLIIIAGFVCALLSALPATAQQESQQQQQGQGDAVQQQVEFSDAELDKAVAAYLEISKIQKKFQESLQTTPDLDQRQALQEKANQKMIQAVENEGMDVAKYSQVIAAVKTNDNLREKFMEKIQKVE
jgi:hypothetical protein